MIDRQGRCHPQLVYEERTVKPLTLKQKRGIVGVFLVVFLLAVANRYLEWGLLGARWDRAMPSILAFLALLALARFGAAFYQQMDDEIAARRAAEAAREAARDKSHDAADAAKLRQDIGLPPS